MIVKVELVVLMAELRPSPLNEGKHLDDFPWLSAYKIMVGVNAASVAAAVTLASTAMSNCYDEEGYYLGGVVIEAHGRAVSSSEFRGYEDHFYQPMDCAGVFYLSGTTTIGISRPRLAGAIKALYDFRRRREQGEIQFEKPSYVRRRFNDSQESKRMRIVCPVCGGWKDHDHRSLTHSFFSASEEWDEDYLIGQRLARDVGPFINHHFQCLAKAGNDVANQGLRFVYEGDAEFDKLPSDKEEPWPYMG